MSPRRRSWRSRYDRRHRVPVNILALNVAVEKVDAGTRLVDQANDMQMPMFAMASGPEQLAAPKRFAALRHAG